MPRVGMEPIRRQDLISAAIDAIHDTGMAGLTMNGIARRAGVSAGLAHHYFGGKNQLLLATMRHLLSELGREVQSRLADAKTPEDRLRAIVRGNFSPCQFRPAVISAWLAFYAQAQTDPDAKRLLKVYTKRLESNLVHAFRGMTGRDEAQSLAETAAALIDGVWIRCSLAGGDLQPDKATVLVETALFHLLEQNTGRHR